MTRFYATARAMPNRYRCLKWARLRRIRIGWLKGRVDDSGKRNKVMLKCGNIRSQRAINSQNISCITDGFLGSARSADGRWIQQDVIQRIQVASQLVQVDQEEQVEFERLFLRELLDFIAGVIDRLQTPAVTSLQFLLLLKIETQGFHIHLFQLQL